MKTTLELELHAVNPCRDWFFMNPNLCESAHFAFLSLLISFRLSGLLPVILNISSGTSSVALVLPEP